MDIDEPLFMTRAALEPTKHITGLVAEIRMLRAQVKTLEGMLPLFMWNRYLKEMHKPDT